MKSGRGTRFVKKGTKLHLLGLVTAMKSKMAVSGLCRTGGSAEPKREGGGGGKGNRKTHTKQPLKGGMKTSSSFWIKEGPRGEYKRPAKLSEKR